MRGTRARSTRSRRTKLRLVAALIIAATIFGMSAIQLSGRMMLGKNGVPEVAAATLEPSGGSEPASDSPPEAPASTTRPIVPSPEHEPAQPPPDASSKPPRPPIPPKASAAESGNQADRKLIALTFDDGPDGKYTPEVLDILKEHGVKGTFFLVGPQVSKYPDIAGRILDEGHSIGNHSWSHKDFKKMTPKQIASEIDRTQQEIADATGYTPHLMRAPYGNISTSLLDALHERDMEHVYWTIDTRDWAGTSVADMRKNVSAHAQPGSVLLMHSFGGKKNALDNTLKLLPQIIDDLSNKGFTFVTVDELIDSGQTRKSVIK